MEDLTPENYKLRAENFDPLSDPESMGGGGKCKAPDCFWCKNSKGADCLKLKCKKITASVDIFNCPYLEKREDAIDSDAVGGIFGFKQ